MDLTIESHNKKPKRTVRLDIKLPNMEEEDYAIVNYAKEVRTLIGGNSGETVEKEDSPVEIGAQRKYVSQHFDFDRYIVGYDESDSFIDNSEYVDETLPEDVIPIHGYYVSSGLLELKKVNYDDTECASSSKIFSEVMEIPPSGKPNKKVAPVKPRCKKEMNKVVGGSSAKDGEKVVKKKEPKIKKENDVKKPRKPYTKRIKSLPEFPSMRLPSAASFNNVVPHANPAKSSETTFQNAFRIPAMNGVVNMIMMEPPRES